MASIATAWVDIVPRITSLDQTLREAFKGVEQQSEETGVESGISFADGLGSGLSRVGSAFAAVGKAALAGAGVAAGAVAAIGKQAFDAYADWEQAVGGVDTLFKGASSTVQRYAQEAYKTAGTSANAYMNQVTSFAASLISSMGGNTSAAADMANTAMQDMSDNANKMGTSLDVIQETYQSLARGNYEMLDNLKLGFGGTKEEMQRLIDTANQWKTANGQAGDLTIDKFADVVEAIHIVQGELGITGTTAKEAATTIQGSWGMLQASWSNWVAEVGKDNADMQSRTAEVFTSAAAVAQNAWPRIQQIAEGALQGIGQALQALIPQMPAPFVQALPFVQQLADGLADGSISLADIAKSAALAVSAFGGFAVVGGNVDTILGAFGAAGTAIESVGGSLSGLAGPLSKAGGLLANFAGRLGKAFSLTDANLGGMGAALIGQLQSAFGGVGTMFTGLLDSNLLAPLKGLGGKMLAPFSALAGRVGSFIAPLTGAFGKAFKGFGATLAGPLQSMLGGIGSLFANFFAPANFLRYFGIAAIAGALVVALGALNESMGGQLTTMVTDFLTTKLPGYLAQFQAWITTQLPVLMQSGIQLLMGLIQGITTALPQLLTTAVTLLTTLVNGIANALPTLLPAAMQMIMTLVQGIVDNLPQIVQSGLNLLTQFVQGIMNALPVLIGMLPNIIISFTNGILDLLPQIMTTGVDLLLKFVDGIVNAIPQLVAALPKIISGFINGIISHLPQIIETGFTLVTKLALGIARADVEIIKAIPAIIAAVWNGLTHVDWGGLGHNVIEGIKNGLMNAGDQIKDAIVGLAESAWSAVKKFFGIASPSKLMRDTVGVMVGRGLANGIIASTSTVTKAATGLAGQAYGVFDDAEFDPSVKLRSSALYGGFTPNTALNAAYAMPANTPSSDGLTVEDVTAAVLAALQGAPAMALRLDSGVMAGELAPALDREFAARSYRGL